MIDWLSALDPRILMAGIGVVALLIAVPLEVAAIRRLRHLKLASGTIFLLLGAVVLLGAAALALVAANLYTYARLTKEQEAARVQIRQLGPRQYAVTVQAKGAAPRHFELRGDEWQIDARVLKWKAIGNLAGFDTVFRLERLAGRYGDIASERTAPRTVHALSEEPGLDLWATVRQYHEYIPFADALYGSAVYVPMADNAEYAVTVSASGLVVRPTNDLAKKAVGGWK